MDWSKAKTIVIIALLVTNLVLGGFLMFDHLQAVNTEKQAAQSAAEYLSAHGIALNCELPATVTKLPVLFVDFEEGTGEKTLSYNGYLLQVTDAGELVPVTLEPGDVKSPVCGASSAVIKAVMQESGIRSIENVSLVYHVDRSGYSDAGEDTAFPSWRVQTDLGPFYIEALQ